VNSDAEALRTTLLAFLNQAKQRRPSRRADRRRVAGPEVRRRGEMQSASEDWDALLAENGWAVEPTGSPEHDRPAGVLQLAETIADGKTVARLVSALMEHRGQIACTDCLARLAVVCANHGLIREAQEAVEQTLTASDLTAQEWTNIGSVYCDGFGKPELALDCFSQAIAVDPGLPQPRVNVWFASFWLMKAALFRRDFERVIELGEQAEGLGAGSEQREASSTYAIWGMALEGRGKQDLAKVKYQSALNLDPECHLAVESMRRVKGAAGAHQAADLDRMIDLMALQEAV
jgi:tetratricopeptide (TPR) repeat protein